MGTVAVSRHVRIYARRVIHVCNRPVSGLTSGLHAVRRAFQSVAPSRELESRCFRFAVAPPGQEAGGGYGLTRSPLRGQRRNESLLTPPASRSSEKMPFRIHLMSGEQ